MAKLCVIPARGGSKRIPRKNIKLFLGKPIIAYSIEAAINSGLFDEVMVSTDDEEIAEISKKYGASVPFMRGEKNSDDFATTFNVLEEVINRYKSLNLEFNQVTCIYATAPFVTEIKLKESFELLDKNNFNCILTVKRFDFPIQRAIKINEGRMEMFNPEYRNSRSQDLEQAFHDVGQLYTFNVNSFFEERKLWMDNTGVLIIDEMEAQDIDTVSDWNIAELKFKLLNEKKNNF